MKLSSKRAIPFCITPAINENRNTTFYVRHASEAPLKSSVLYLEKGGNDYIN